MKLVSLYIENFGGLHGYSLDFDRDLTVIHAPNGFGKTTLAEFIRAVFYGLPRKVKTLDKSKRQKYAPWQGGQFGGNLVFEHQGQRYRIERTFGTTPKGDTFTLIDLQTGKKSDRFSEEIGTELFQLDADSFERSTYLPQLRESGSLTTDSIQAKLGNLVEDTGDVGNYDKACAALKAARSGYIPYRGSGGTVAEARNRVLDLQRELDREAGLTRDLEAVDQEIHALAETERGTRAELESLRGRIRLASQTVARAACHREYERLTAEENRLREDLDRMNRDYPMGLPDADAWTRASRAASEEKLLTGQTVTTREDREAEAWLAENEHRFAGGLPEPGELESCRRELDEYVGLWAQIQSTGLTAPEQDQYRMLRALAETGALDNPRLEAWEESIRKLAEKRHGLQALELSSEDRQRLDALESFFAPGLPDPARIQAHRDAQAEAESLRREKEGLLAELAQVPEKRSKTGPVVLLVLALAALGAGVWAVLQPMAWGWGVIAMAGVLLAGGAALLWRAGAGERAWQEAQHKLRNRMAICDDTIRTIDGRAAAFAGQYTAVLPLSDALYEIQDKLDDYGLLAHRAAALTADREALADEIRISEETLTRELGPGDPDDALLRLRLAQKQLEDLEAKRQASDVRRTEIQGRLDLCRDRTERFLGRYFDDVQPAEYRALLSRLQRDSETCVRCRARVAAWQTRCRDHGHKTEICRQALDAFFARFGLIRAENPEAQLLQIRDDMRIYDRVVAELETAVRDREAYRRAHREELAVSVPETAEEPGELENQEAERSARLEALRERSVNLRQRQLRLQEELDRIPELQDELIYWQDRLDTHRNRAEILDSTLAYLEKARENLQNSYLGPVRRSFEDYMARLMGENPGSILLTPDLQVQLERSGKARELGYFSAGQTDLVMLCMRFALVDGLFTGEKPFIILDDPFVNLDDDHMAQAGCLLKELAEDKQILYLTCSGSRALS